MMIIQPLSGNMPAASGVPTRHTSKMFTGNMPASEGGLFRQIGKMFTGNMPAASGGSTRHTSKMFTGNMPASEGGLASGYKTFQTASGTMGEFTGAVTGVFKEVGVVFSRVWNTIKTGIGIGI
jgi:hypothetical protein